MPGSPQELAEEAVEEDPEAEVKLELHTRLDKVQTILSAYSPKDFVLNEQDCQTVIGLIKDVVHAEPFSRIVKTETKLILLDMLEWLGKVDVTVRPARLQKLERIKLVEDLQKLRPAVVASFAEYDRAVARVDQLKGQQTELAKKLVALEAELAKIKLDLAAVQQEKKQAGQQAKQLQGPNKELGERVNKMIADLEAGKEEFESCERQILRAETEFKKLVSKFKNSI